MDENSCERGLQYSNDAVYDILKQASPEKLRQFIKNEMDEDGDLKERFIILFGDKEKKKSKTVEEIKKKMIKSMEEYDRYHKYVFYNKPDFERFYKEADTWPTKGFPLEAMKIYQAASESIAEISNGVDDSDGDFSSEFEFAVQKTVAAAAELDLPEKKEVIHYLFDRYIENNPDYYREFYDSALEQIADGKEELLYWEELIKPVFENIPREGVAEISYEEQDTLNCWLWIQERLNRNEAAHIYRDYYRVSGRIFMKFLDLLIEKGNLEQARDIAEEREPYLFPLARTKAEEYLASYYLGKDWEKYYERMKSLFHGGDWRYYDEMKKTLPPDIWQSKLPELIEYVKAKSSYSALIDLYIRENRKADALEVLLKNGWADSFREYQKVLGDVNPKAYFGAFRELVLPQTKNASGRGHYQRVAGWLRSMKKIKGQEQEFQKFIEEIRLINARRPAFLGELKGL